MMFVLFVSALRARMVDVLAVVVGLIVQVFIPCIFVITTAVVMVTEFMVRKQEVLNHKCADCGSTTVYETCSATGCDEWAMWQGLCHKHYRRAKRHMTCKIKGCNSIVLAKGYCSKHYQRWYRTGNARVDGRRRGSK